MGVIIEVSLKLWLLLKEWKSSEAFLLLLLHCVYKVEKVCLLCVQMHSSISRVRTRREKLKKRETRLKPGRKFAVCLALKKLEVHLPLPLTSKELFDVIDKIHNWLLPIAIKIIFLLLFPQQKSISEKDLNYPSQTRVSQPSYISSLWERYFPHWEIIFALQFQCKLRWTRWTWILSSLSQSTPDVEGGARRCMEEEKVHLKMKWLLSLSEKSFRSFVPSTFVTNRHFRVETILQNEKN